MDQPFIQYSPVPNSEYNYKPLRYLKPEIRVEQRDSGEWLLESTLPLCRPGHSVAHELARQAAETPYRTWLGARDTRGDWQKITYQQGEEKTNAIAQWLLNKGMGQATPILIISPNSLNHALLILGAMKARVPVCSMSTPYALMDKSLRKFKHCIEVAKPALIFAEDGPLFAGALQEVAHDSLEFLTAEGALPELAATSFEELLQTEVTSGVPRSMNAIAPDTVAKYFFTSGSTGMPKAVVHTHGMIMAYLAGIKSLYEPSKYFQGEDFPVYLAWMPWSHISAGSMTFHDTIAQGGTLYLDDGKPVPGLFSKTIENIKAISPTQFGSAPIGFTWLADAMEQDAELRNAFFSRLELMVYGGAAMPDDLVARIHKLAIAELGERIAITSGYGATETHGISIVSWPTDDLGLIGLPFPGAKIKLTPTAGKLEVRVKGDAVFKEYLGEPQKSAESFDEEGYFCVGDAAKLLDPEDMSRGLAFDGRISEDFKLLSGTWVSAGNLRERVISGTAGLLSHCVICGENQNHVAALVWLSELGLSLLESKGLQALSTRLEQEITTYNRRFPSSSTRLKHVMVLATPPSLEDSEITDKGYVNAAAVIQRRQQEYARLYDGSEQPLIIFDAPFLTRESAS